MTGDGGTGGDAGGGLGTGGGGGIVSSFLGSLAAGAVLGSGGGRMAARGAAQLGILMQQKAARAAQLQANLSNAAVYSTVPRDQPTDILRSPLSKKMQKLAMDLNRLLASQRDVRLSKREQERVRHQIAVTQEAMRHQSQIDPVPTFQYYARYGINNPPIPGATYQG